MPSSSLVYLACPYSDPNPDVQQQRFEAVNFVAAYFMAQGVHIISPISQTHPIALAGDLPKGWDFWGSYDYALLTACSKLIVVMLPGWELSQGVRAEINIAHRLGLSIEYCSSEGMIVKS